MKHKTDSDIMDDRKLSQLLKHNLLEAPPSPWFTRKVLNRLPDRKVRVASLIEYAIYLIGIVVTGFYTARFVTMTLQTGVITVGDLFTYGVLFTLCCSLIYMLISPWFSPETE